MKRGFVLLLALAMLCVGAAALAEEAEAVTLEVNTAKLPLYEAGDPYLEGLVSSEGDGLPVLVLPVKKNLQLQVTVGPRSVKNKKFTITPADEELVRVRGNSLTGLKAGETVLTVASEQDPSVTVQYRLAVIQQVTRLTLKSEEKSVAVGGTVALTPEFLPEEATRKQVTWSSGDERIATVDADGRVTGVKRGNARIIAVTTDGSNIRANISLQVTQPAGEITLDKTEVTLDVKRNTVLKATVLPKDTSDKKVVWASSDESVATVNNQGRITGVALGDCEIICRSASTGEVEARATVHVQQPVQSISFGDAPMVYVNETAQVTWTVEPANASNPEIALTSSNPKVLTVEPDGTVTGVAAGEAYVNAVSTDGSNRRTRVKVKVGQHVESVQMKRSVGYIDLGSTSTTGAVLTPKNAFNKNMTWEIEDPSVASISPVKNQPWRVNIKGLSEGQTTLTGVTEDGGLRASMTVKVGSFEKSLTLVKDHTYVDTRTRGIVIRVRNVSDLRITSVTAEVTVTDGNGDPVECNGKDGGNVFTVVYRGTLDPGSTSRDDKWKPVNFTAPDVSGAVRYEVRIKEFQIDNDWVKTIRKKNQPTLKCPANL